MKAPDCEPAPGKRIRRRAFGSKAGSELADAKRGATFNAELKMKTIYKTLEVTGREKGRHARRDRDRRDAGRRHADQDVLRRRRPASWCART